jgi:distribution and morphology protein 34
MRKRKKRVVNLRGDRDGAESSGVSTEANTPLPSTNVSETASVIPEEREREEDLATPPKSPVKPGLRFEGRHGSLDVGEPSRLSEKSAVEGLLPAAPLLSSVPNPALRRERPKLRSAVSVPSPIEEKEEKERTRSSSRSGSRSRPPLTHSRLRQTQQTTSPLLRSLSFEKASAASIVPMSPTYAESSTSSSGGILEQAWMLKMAQEIARKVAEEKGRDGELSPPSHQQVGLGQNSNSKAGGLWPGEEEIDAPPAYHA